MMDYDCSRYIPKHYQHSYYIYTGAWTQPIARAYEEHMNGAVIVEINDQVDPPDLFPNIINEAQSQIGLYDGFFTNPSVTGSVVEYNGFADLTPFVGETVEKLAEWEDILLGYRKSVAQYEKKILMFPVDGDMLSMFYRRDVLDAFGLKVPRTWEEYTAVAKATHNQTFDGKVLTGSCVGRSIGCAGAYWANLVISSYTQTNGPSTGHLFDTADMMPLTGPVMEEALLMMENQVKYGSVDGTCIYIYLLCTCTCLACRRLTTYLFAVFGLVLVLTEFDKCIGPVNIAEMLQGECVMTYNWGNNFKRYLEEGSQIRGKYGVAPTPGSTRVLDRDTMQLVNCTKELCPYGEEYDDIGWVNRAPYMAFSGWACAVNNYTDSVSKRLATEFCAFAASKQESIKAIIPNATASGVNGQDPFRASHLNIEDYVAAGYERETAMQYIDTLSKGLSSDNVVTDIRFPKSEEIYSVLDYEYFHYLRARRNGTISDARAPAMRRAVGEDITEQWEMIINNYNGRLPILEAYQRLRDVYAPGVDLNQLDNIRAYGYLLVTIIMMCSIGFGTWSIRYRTSQIVRASQPFFLVMICAGTMVLGLTIIPLGIDDGDSSPLSCSLEDSEGCDKGCMAVPWLLALGWSIVFSALFSKLWRVK
jgi:multiple sugar transport system substrate-binding protein